MQLTINLRGDAVQNARAISTAVGGSRHSLGRAIQQAQHRPPPPQQQQPTWEEGPQLPKLGQMQPGGLAAELTRRARYAGGQCRRGSRSPAATAVALTWWHDESIQSPDVRFSWINPADGSVHAGHVVLVSQLEFYFMFRAAHPNTLGCTSFMSLKPFYVRACTPTDRETCFCIKCENPRRLVAALRRTMQQREADAAAAGGTLAPPMLDLPNLPRFSVDVMSHLAGATCSLNEWHVDGCPERTVSPESYPPGFEFRQCMEGSCPDCCTSDGRPVNLSFDTTPIPGFAEASMAVELFEYEEVARRDGGKPGKKLSLLRRELTHSELATRLQEELPPYILHDWRRRWQAAQAALLLLMLPLFWVLHHVDFSMNCLSPVQHEAQSLFFNTKAASLLSIIAYFRDPITLKIRKLIYPVFSDVLTHSADFVEAAMEKVAQDLVANRGAPKFTTEVRGTDQCAGQFRSKRNFVLARRRAMLLGITCYKMFNESGHGKGLVDGATVPLKRAIRRDCLTRDPGRDSVATSTLGMAIACAALINRQWSQRQEAKCHAHAARVVFEERIALVVTQEDIDEYSGVEIDYEKLVAPGTMQTHAMQFRPDGTVIKAKLSCWCPECLGRPDAQPCPNTPWVGTWLALNAEYGGRGPVRQLLEPLTEERAHAGSEALYALLELSEAPRVSGGAGRPPHVCGTPAACGAMLVCGKMRLVLPEHVRSAANPADRSVLLPRLSREAVNRYATSVVLAGVEVERRAAAGAGAAAGADGGAPRRTRQTTARMEDVVSFEQHLLILEELPMGDEEQEQEAGTSRD
ncbi:hypothetical protein FOA52_003789 [Chlamydomonas sp. UWO 241]|nr:hypothetical protein FOA52_003789 [Chlamydomonas sp. UWO 241]